MDSFNKSLTKTDIEQKLSVKTDFVTNNGLVDGAELVATDYTTALRRTYLFELSTRTTGGYLKPVFQSREWLRFVRDNCLQEKDTIDFWKEDNGRFGIRATRNYF